MQQEGRELDCVSCVCINIPEAACDTVQSTAMLLRCSSVVRHFRYAATMTACQLVSSWIRTMQTLNEARETAQRQLDAESKKKTNKVCLPMVQGRDTVHRECLTS